MDNPLTLINIIKLPKTKYQLDKPHNLFYLQFKEPYKLVYHKKLLVFKIYL